MMRFRQMDTNMTGQTISDYEITYNITESPSNRGSPDGESILHTQRDSSGSDIMLIENLR